MHQVIIEIDSQLLERLDRVAPARDRKRSAFIREAIRKALDERVEQEMERAYREQPQAAEEVDLDPATWAPAPKRTAGKRGKR